MNVLDQRFKYVPALQTNIMTTFCRYGFKPTTDEERQARQLRQVPDSELGATSLVPTAAARP